MYIIQSSQNLCGNQRACFICLVGLSCEAPRLRGLEALESRFSDHLSFSNLNLPGRGSCTARKASRVSHLPIDQGAAFRLRGHSEEGILFPAGPSQIEIKGRATGYEPHNPQPTAGERPVCVREKQPLATACASSRSKMAIADVLAQFGVGQSSWETWDFRRTAFFGMFGLGYQGGAQYFIWNQLVGKLYSPTATTKLVAFVNFCKAFVCDPLLFFPSFYSFRSGVLGSVPSPRLAPPRLVRRRQPRPSTSANALRRALATTSSRTGGDHRRSG